MCISSNDRGGGDGIDTGRDPAMQCGQRTSPHQVLSRIYPQLHNTLGATLPATLNNQPTPTATDSPPLPTLPTYLPYPTLSYPFPTLPYPTYPTLPTYLPTLPILPKLTCAMACCGKMSSECKAVSTTAICAF